MLGSDAAAPTAAAIPASTVSTLPYYEDTLTDKLSVT